MSRASPWEVASAARRTPCTQLRRSAGPLDN
ncbi:hypothetical protein CSUB01_12603, partial [Colletotrichum sublineola]